MPDTIIERLAPQTIPELKCDPLDHVLDRGLLPADGLWLEFGVFRGSSINKIARHRPAQTVYGFDSFEGLPEAWDRGHPGWWSQKGAFSTEGQLPKVEPNVKLIKGWFSDTLPGFLAAHAGPISFLHIDCDLYSSTKFVLDTVATRLADPCVVVFDEIFNYPGWEKHEALAFVEFLETQRGAWRFRWIGMLDRFDPLSPGRSAASQSAALTLHRA